MKLRFIDPRMFKHIDWLLFANILVLILFSLVAIASAVSEPLLEGTGSLSAALNQLNLDHVVQQLTWLGVGLFAMFVVLLPDYHAIGEYYKWIYTILIILLVAVLLFGKTVNGTKGWFRIGNSGFQPSEIGKVAIIILLARMISDRTKGKDGGITKVRELLPILGAFLLPLALIIAQPDFGTAMVYVFTFFSMLFLARTSLKLLLGMVGCVCVALPAAWFVLADWQQNRIYSFLGIQTADMTAQQVAETRARPTRQTIATVQASSAERLVPRWAGRAGCRISPKTYRLIFASTTEAVALIGSMIIILLYRVIIRTLGCHQGQGRFGADHRGRAGDDAVPHIRKHRHERGRDADHRHSAAVFQLRGVQPAHQYDCIRPCDQREHATTTMEL